MLVNHRDQACAEHIFSRSYYAPVGGTTTHYNPGDIKEARNPLQECSQSIKVHYTHQW